jgi:DNA polymerase-3 subunit alpha
MGFTIEQLHEPLPAGITNSRGVRFGLAAIKNVGEGPISAILKARNQGGPFRSLEDFCDRIERTALNKRALESLIKSGAMDALPGRRRQKLAILDQALAAGIEAQRAREAGQSSMFDLLGRGGGAAGISVQAIPLPAIQETPQDHKEQLAWEKELLGTYVSDHPLAKALEMLDLNDITPLGQIGEEQVGQTLIFAGMILQTRRLATKKGDSMLVAVLEDLEATIELVAFPRSYEKYRDLLKDDMLLRVSAKVDKSRRDESIQLLLESAEALEAGGGGQEPAIEMDLEGLEEQIPASAIAPPQEDGPHPADSMAASPSDMAESMAEPQTTPAALQHAAQAATASEQPVSIIRQRVKAGANGNGNGNGSATPPTPTHSLRLYLPRSHDFDADVRLMQAVDRVLRQSVGEDQVIIHMPNAIGTVLLQPRHKVRCTDSLVGALRDVLGQDGVVVE